MDRTTLKRLFWVLLALTLLTQAALGRIDDGIRTKVGLLLVSTRVPLGFQSFTVWSAWCGFGTPRNGTAVES